MQWTARAKNVAAWITPLAFVAIGWRYLQLIAEAATDPPYRGNNVWLIVWTAAAVVVIASIALSPRRAFRIWRFAIGGAAAVIIVLSGVLSSALVTLWLLLLCVLLGDRLLRNLVSGKESITLALPLGYVAFAFAGLALAVSGLYRPLYVWILLVLLTALEARHAITLAREVRLTPQTSSLPIRESYVLIILTSLVALTNLIWAVAPEIEYDSLNYHLAVPRLYLDSGRLIDLPYFFHSYFAHLPEMFFGLCIALGGGPAAKLANFGLGIGSMFAVFFLAQMLFTRRVALWAAALYYTTPLTGWLSGTVYTDLMVGYLICTSLIALLWWRQSRAQGWLTLCALLAGGAIGVKMNAAYAVIGLGLAVIFINWRRTLQFAALTILTAVPWYLPAYVFTGNPVFPMMNGVFKSARAEPVNTLMDSGIFGIGTAPHALIELPSRLTFNGRFGVPAGALGVLALFCVPFGLVLLLIQRNTAARIAASVLAVYIVFWAATFQSARYYMAVFPIVAVLGAAGAILLYQTELSGKVTRLVMLMLLVAQAELMSSQYQNLPERFPLRVALGQESREAFLARAVSGYSASQQVNRTIRPGQRVLGVDTEHVRFYLQPPIDVLSETLLDHPLRNVGGSDDDIATGLERIGYAYVLASRQAMRFPQPWQAYIKPQFLDRFATLEYADNEVALYRLKSAK